MSHPLRWLLAVLLLWRCAEVQALASPDSESSRQGRRHRRSERKHATKTTADHQAGTDSTEDRAGDVRSRPKVTALLDEARSALLAQDPDGALKKAESAYKKQASSETLCLLAQIAVAQKRFFDAHDLFRRCLADTVVMVDPAVRSEAQQIPGAALNGLGDLHVSGDKDALVYVDDRLRGSLPLLLPVRVAPGLHAVSLSSSGHWTRGKVEVPAGQAREIRFDALSGAVLVSVPPMVVFAQESGTALEPQLLSALEKGSQLVGYSLTLRDGKAEVCDGLLPECLLDAARRTSAGYVLAIRVSPSAAGKEIFLSLWDAQVGELAGQETARCAPCSDEAQLATVAERLAAALKRGRSRPRGALTVSSIPSAAQVKLGGRLLGQTPWKGSVFAGQQQIEVTFPGYEPQTLITTVAPGQQASLSALLSPLLLAEPGPRGSVVVSPALRRPIWRVVTGAAAMGVGMLMIGIGGSGLAADGTCVPPLQPPAQVCRETIHSATAGGALLGVGLSLTIGGAVLVGLPPRPEAAPSGP